MAQPSRHALLVREAREHLIAFRDRISTLETSVRHSVVGTVDCMATSRELMAYRLPMSLQRNGGDTAMTLTYGETLLCGVIVAAIFAVVFV